MKKIILLLLICLFSANTSFAARAKIATVSQDPYASAYLLDAVTGEVLFEENGSSKLYPASVLKMMVLHVILEKVKDGVISLDEMVQVTNEAAKMGGSQVYLDPKESFTIEDLLYALTIQSANDAAVALAIHISGTKSAFVELMNEKALEIGMNDTEFHSVHGLPPSEGQKPDVTTARDLAVLAREMARNPETFKYTSTREREFRNGEFIMRTHNHLLASVDGCDGFKTGYFKAAGFSIVATAKRGGNRMIAVVMGSLDRKVRDVKAKELLAKGFSMVPARTEPPVIQEVTNEASAERVQSEQTGIDTPDQVTTIESAGQEVSYAEEKSGGKMGTFFIGFGAGIVVSILFAILRSRRNPRRRRRFTR